MAWAGSSSAVLSTPYTHRVIRKSLDTCHQMTHARAQGGVRHMLVTQGEIATATHHVTEVTHNVHVDAQLFLGLQMQGEGWCGGKGLMV
jgi:hypothetical protein